MNELENVSDEVQRMWDYIRDNRKILGIPLTNSSGLDILNVLRDVYLTIDEDTEDAKRKLTLVATIILSAANGDADTIVNEIRVKSAMENFDDSITEILNEKP
jgi:hypothetical protein